jgi:hypothetical protein
MITSAQAHTAHAHIAAASTARILSLLMAVQVSQCKNFVFQNF